MWTSEIRGGRAVCSRLSIFSSPIFSSSFIVSRLPPPSANLPSAAKRKDIMGGVHLPSISFRFASLKTMTFSTTYCFTCPCGVGLYRLRVSCCPVTSFNPYIHNQRARLPPCSSPVTFSRHDDMTLPISYACISSFQMKLRGAYAASHS